MKPHVALAMLEASQVGDARRIAQRMAQALGLDDATVGRVALVITELGTNLVRHARDGLILLRDDPAGGGSIEILSLDRGPGMSHLDRCLEDGYSTGSSAGTGLGAIRRLSDAFSAFSCQGKGTVIAVSLTQRHTDAAGKVGSSALQRDTGAFSLAALCVAARGETVAGDGWAFTAEGERAVLMLADGLGHGPQAAAAAQAATDIVQRSAVTASPCAVLESAHTGLRNTRGAAVAVATLEAASRRLLYAGAGNISGRLISGVQDRSLLSQHGTIGLQIRRLQETAYHWDEHAILVMHSDGIASRWRLDDVPGLLQCDPVIIAGWILKDHCRGRDDATVVVVRRA